MPEINEGDVRKQQFDYVRRLVQHEDTLVNVRTTWTLVFHGFLFSSFTTGVGLYEKLKFSKSWFDPIGSGLFIVCVLGFASAIAGFIGVRTALKQLEITTAWWKNSGAATLDQRFPPIYIHADGKWKLSSAHYLLILATVWFLFGVMVLVAPSFYIAATK